MVEKADLRVGFFFFIIGLRRYLAPISKPSPNSSSSAGICCPLPVNDFIRAPDAFVEYQVSPESPRNANFRQPPAYPSRRRGRFTLLPVEISASRPTPPYFSESISSASAKYRGADKNNGGSQSPCRGAGAPGNTTDAEIRGTNGKDDGKQLGGKRTFKSPFRRRSAACL